MVKTLMSMLDLQALENATLQTDPFDFLVVPNFLPAQQLSRVNADYPQITNAANHALDKIGSAGPAFNHLIEELEGKPFAEALGRKFDLDLAAMPTTITVRKFCERTDGNIHTDHPSKVLTVLIYFNEHWEHEDGQLRMLRSRDNIDDFAAQVPPLGGTLLAFRRTDSSWHGHTSFVGERRMLQLNYLKSGKLAVIAQRASRFGTHFCKNVLGMR